jgi:hypothetical protein
MFKILSGTNVAGPNDLQISHNTLFQSGTLIWAGQFNGIFIPKNNFVFKDNIAAHNGYGVIGDNDGVGGITLGHYFPNAVFTKNILLGGSAGLYSNYQGNYFPSSWDSVFVNQAGGDYRVVSGSQYSNSATDGQDLGANIDLVKQLTDNVITGTNIVVTSPPPTPPSVSCLPSQTNSFSGCYFNDLSLSTPIYTRVDNSINFDWGTGSPNPLINTDQFSVRWVGDFSFTNQSYKFTVTSDDGFRLYIDNVLVLDYWIGQPPTTYTVVRSLSSGVHQIKMEYFEDRVGATATLSWQAEPQTQAIRGDINLDHVVNTLDWSLMNSAWFTSNSNSDLNSDGSVNSLDFAILSSNWLRTW